MIVALGKRLLIIGSVCVCVVVCVRVSLKLGSMNHKRRTTDSSMLEVIWDYDYWTANKDGKVVL